jgi:hypothetical protein
MLSRASHHHSDPVMVLRRHGLEKSTLARLAGPEKTRVDVDVRVLSQENRTA